MKDTGANFQVTVDGKSRSYRDTPETALEAGIFLKELQPQSEVVVRDVRCDVRIVIGWKNGAAFSCDPISRRLPLNRIDPSRLLHVSRKDRYIKEFPDGASPIRTWFHSFWLTLPTRQRT
jgi:hypothetical protein